MDLDGYVPLGFHEILREYSDLLGYPKQFTIYDQSDSRSAVKQCIKELELDEKTYKPNVVQNRISLMKNHLITATAYRNTPELIDEDQSRRMGRTCDIYDLYTRKCKQSGAMDFDDLLLNTNILLRDFPEAREAIAGRFRYVLVDEYQDTNRAQYIILRRLADGHHNISVVGDDSQSIYGFRGAQIENILRFKKDYPEAKEFRLEQNYRSTQNIVGAANSLIAKNERRLKKECFSKAGQGEKIGLIKAFTEQEEAYLIASSIIERIYADKAAYKDFAILYRTNAQSRALEESLRRKNLPYRIYGGHAFFERAEIRDMLAYFKLVTNPRDDESLRRVINQPPRGIGETTMDRLSEAARTAGCPLLEAIFLPAEKLYAAGLKDSAIGKMREFGKIIESLAEKSDTSDAYALAVEAGNQSGLLTHFKGDSSPEGQARFENIEELFNSIKTYVDEETEMRRETSDLDIDEFETTVTLSDYLENISLLSEVEKEELQEGEDEADNKIALMTVHSSKGLEFPYVYVAGMEENLFPSESMNGTMKDIEEERRLFYVALTRAMKCVTISFAKNRMKWGRQESNAVSRFVKEIDSRYMSDTVDSEEMPFASHSATEFRTDRNSGGYWQRATRPQQNQRPQQPVSRPQQPSFRQQPAFSRTPARTPDPNFRPDPISELRVGQRVEHDRFGFGSIISFDGEGANMKAVVDFEEGGRKTLLLKFAKLRIVR
jgi:Superfamily I DNA and RNA helicases